MTSKFFLSSHDYISSPNPRISTVLAHFASESGREYIHIHIDPPIPAGVLWKSRPITELYLVLTNANDALEMVESRMLMVHIFVMQEAAKPVLPFDEICLAKVGIGTIHSSMEQALRYAPTGE